MEENLAVNKDTICNKCNKGVVRTFEDRGGYSARCDCCGAVNHCRCESRERAISFFQRGITRA